MPRREKFGKLVLLEETEATGLGPEYRAAKLGAAGLEKIVTIVRLKPAISGHPEVARALMDQSKVAAQLQNPNVLRILGIGKVEQTYYVSYEHVEGKSLAAILERCRQESFPFSAEHALLIASKVASALEYAHGRRNDAGTRYFHGLLTPACVLVSYEGEVRVKGFGQWPARLREAGALAPEDLRYVAPEQAAGGTGDPRSDVYALGAILLETLTGQAPDGPDLAARVAGARLLSPPGDDDSLPGPLAEILGKALASDPGGRYGEMPELRKAIDTLLFSGDFTPTTFNMAFFMHSLYREDIEQEARALKGDQEASYLEFLAEEPRAASAPSVPSTKTEPIDPRLVAAVKAAEFAPAEPAMEPPSPAAPSAPTPASHHEASPGPGVTAREAASGFTFHKGEKKGGKAAPLLGGLAAVLALAGGAWYFLAGRAPAPSAATAPAPTTLSPAAAAALQRVRELEDKLAALEKEKAEAEVQAAEEAKKKFESQAAAKGQQVDPAALQRAQEEARRRAKAEQERRQQEELRRLAEEKRAEEERLAAERRKAEEEAARAAEAARVEQARLEAERAAQAAAATLPPATIPATLPPTTIPAIRPGTLVNLSDPGVTPPVADRTPSPVYPPIALRQRVEGTVELNVFVDEKGNVVDAQVVKSAGGRAGLNEAAVESVKKRRYRPATKDGVPVKVWMSVIVRFELPR